MTFFSGVGVHRVTTRPGASHVSKEIAAAALGLFIFVVDSLMKLLVYVRAEGRHAQKQWLPPAALARPE